MPETISQAILEESIAEVLEKMFFIRAMNEPSPDSIAGPCTIARMTFEGSPSGELTLSIARPAARSIAADFLADSEDALAETQVDEVMCELANMICGCVLTRTESETAFRLSSPTITETPGAGAPIRPATHAVATHAVTTHAVALNGGSLTIRIAVGGQVCPPVKKFACSS